MKTFMRRAALLCVALACTVAVSAQDVKRHVILNVNSEDGRFASGERVEVKLSCDSLITEPLLMQTFVNGIVSEEKEISLTGQDMTILDKSYDGPVSVMIFVSPVGGTDRKNRAQVGFMVDDGSCRPAWKAPHDLMKFWRRQLRDMRDIPITAKFVPVPLEGQDAIDFECYEVELSSVDTIPVRGYLAMPKGARDKSLPIVMYMHGAGVAGQWCRARVHTALYFSKISGGAITFDFNAHGMFNGAPQEYYDELDRGRLHRYVERPLKDHESFYFRTMFLRAVRSLDFLTQLPQWDGRRVMVHGESQGGAQAAAVASLDRRVTHAMLVVPGMFGLGGVLHDRLSCWPRFIERDGLDSPARELAPYYDMALLLRHTKAECFVEIGLCDTTIPPYEAFTVVNTLNPRKTTVATWPYRGHIDSDMPAVHREPWHSCVMEARNEWVSRALKQD